jgi:putative lipoprotein
MKSFTYLSLGFLLAGCGSEQSPATKTGNGATLTGSVSYRERMALPPDAVVEVSLVDVSPEASPGTVIAETTVASEGRQVPIPFELRYDANRVAANRTYAVKAAIRSGGETMFETQTPVPVTTTDAPVEVWLVRASGSGGGTGGGSAGGATSDLLHTVWQLQDVGGTPALPNVEATLEFPADGKIAGRGSCNRFFGGVEFTGDQMRVSQMGATQMACIGDAMTQESKYLGALQNAERFARDGTALLVYCKGMDKPLRFVPKA